MIQRGSQTLFADIFEQPKAVLPKPLKGRNSQLHNRRNECLIDRYFYYGQQKWRYSAILEILETEFFISRVTIPEVIADNYPTLSALKKQQPTVKDFQKKWPHLVW